ncbi:hypothetical protein HW132_08405 [Brasilonema sp. CT11]|nr:hypothetical protein [Brasilonema sp. CT11]
MVNFIIFSYSVVVPVENVENLMHVYFKDALTGCYLWKTCGKTGLFFHRVFILKEVFHRFVESFPQKIKTFHKAILF